MRGAGGWSFSCFASPYLALLKAALPSCLAVPQDFSQQLHQFTSNGFRVLGLAYKLSVAVGTFEEAQEVTRWVDMQVLALLSYQPGFQVSPWQTRYFTLWVTSLGDYEKTQIKHS